MRTCLLSCCMYCYKIIHSDSQWYWKRKFQYAIWTKKVHSLFHTERESEKNHPRRLNRNSKWTQPGPTYIHIYMRLDFIMIGRMSMALMCCNSHIKVCEFVATLRLKWWANPTKMCLLYVNEADASAREHRSSHEN